MYRQQMTNFAMLEEWIGIKFTQKVRNKFKSTRRIVAPAAPVPLSR